MEAELVIYAVLCGGFFLVLAIATAIVNYLMDKRE